MDYGLHESNNYNKIDLGLSHITSEYPYLNRRQVNSRTNKVIDKQLGKQKPWIPERHSV